MSGLRLHNWDILLRPCVTGEITNGHVLAGRRLRRVMLGPGTRQPYLERGPLLRSRSDAYLPSVRFNDLSRDIKANS